MQTTAQAAINAYVAKQRTISKLHYTMQLALTQLQSKTSILLEAESDGVFIGYGGHSRRGRNIAVCKAVIMQALIQLRARNINWGNLHDTNGYDDSTVTFTIGGHALQCNTCYE
jgi:hypothetical protein